MRQAREQRYVPPNRRRPSEDAVADTEQRGLEGASGNSLSQVRLVALQEGKYDMSGCPLDIEEQEGQAPAAWLIFYPDRQPMELLRFFSEAFAGGTGRLEFPASLSKRERAWWHGLADPWGLHTQSMGMGDARYLTIGTRPPSGGTGYAAHGGGAKAGVAGLTREQQQRARQIYDCCQMEGGKYWERSRGEIEAMVASGEPLPPGLQKLADKQLRGQHVNELLLGGNPTAALALLSEDPKLAWVKDLQTGGYPIHIAAFKGYESVVWYLASLPGVLEQRDRQRDTALALARRRRHMGMEELLLVAGANPEVASFQEPSGGCSVAGGPGAEENEGEYCSWSAEEQQRYRHGGEGGRGGGGGSRRGSSNVGRGGEGGSMRSSARAELSRCPW